jgi:hypothetical protein
LWSCGLCFRGCEACLSPCEWWQQCDPPLHRSPDFVVDPLDVPPALELASLTVAAWSWPP